MVDDLSFITNGFLSAFETIESLHLNTLNKEIKLETLILISKMKYLKYFEIEDVENYEIIEIF